MPNTLAHVAAQGALSRAGWRGLDPRWLYLGCLLPDVPWILRRAAVALALPLDPIDLRIHLMGLASLAGVLLLCAGLALVSRAPRAVFGVLAVNALLHLLLDACEEKWGNGVHLLAPFSWRMTRFGAFAGGSAVDLGLTLLGAALLGWELLRPPRAAIPFTREPRRWAAALALAGVWLLFPLPFAGAIEASDSYSVRTLRRVQDRAGRSVGLDRVRFVDSPGGGSVVLWTGERVRAEGAVPERDARVSLRGTFLAPDRLRIDSLAVHDFDRDAPSYAGVVLLAMLWLRPARQRRFQRSPRHRPQRPSRTSTRA